MLFERNKASKKMQTDRWEDMEAKGKVVGQNREEENSNFPFSPP